MFFRKLVSDCLLFIGLIDCFFDSMSFWKLILSYGLEVWLDGMVMVV